MNSPSFRPKNLFRFRFTLRRARERPPMTVVLKGPVLRPVNRLLHPSLTLSTGMFVACASSKTRTKGQNAGKSRKKGRKQALGYHRKFDPPGDRAAGLTGLLLFSGLKLDLRPDRLD